eukprot:scaffold35605_cov41-Cyclotella_meneghiniana.AAC.10
MKSLQEGVGAVSPQQLKIAMNKWDRENAEHKISSEDNTAISSKMTTLSSVHKPTSGSSDVICTSNFA